MPDLDSEITDYAAGILLRYFRAVGSLSASRPAIAIERDRELLRLHWALSPSVADLVSYVIERRHEIQTVLASKARTEDATVRGRLDAVATVRLRRTSGLATAVISHEPLRSYRSGPNQLLGWVLAQASSLAARFGQVSLDSRGYRAAVEQAILRLSGAKKVQGVAQIAAQAVLSRRPTAGSMLEASRSRRTLYRKAADAYRNLLAVEAGDPETIGAMLRHTLLGPLEPWRRFELAVGLSVAEELSAATAAPLSLNLLVGETHRPLALAGRFAVFWQWPTEHYSIPDPEPSEAVTREILGAYGLSAASDRPDLVVIDRLAGEAAAIVEVKYLTGDDASDRIRSAATQIVRYSRGFRPLADGTALRGRSLLAVSQGTEGTNLADPPPPGVPAVADFSGIKAGALRGWAQRLLPARSA